MTDNPMREDVVERLLAATARAEEMEAELEQARADRDKAQANYQFMVERADAAEKLAADEAEAGRILAAQLRHEIRLRREVDAEVSRLRGELDDAGYWRRAMAMHREAAIRYRAVLRRAGTRLAVEIDRTRSLCGVLDAAWSILYSEQDGSWEYPGQVAAHLRVEVSDLRQRAEKAEANYQFMVGRACDEKLDGYRELGAQALSNLERAEAAEATAEELHAEIESLREELRQASIRGCQCGDDEACAFLRRAEAAEAEVKRLREGISACVRRLGNGSVVRYSDLAALLEVES